MASSVNTPRTHHSAVGLGAVGWRRSLPPDGSEGLGMDRATFHKAQLIASHVNHHRVALAERAIEDAQSQRIQQPPLQGTLERTRPIHWIIPLTDEEVFRRVTELDRDFAVTQPLEQAAQLDFDDLANVFLLERVEEHDFVDAVDELRPEMGPQRLLVAQVR